MGILYIFRKEKERLVNMSIVARVKDLVGEKKITIAELERNVGISSGQIRKWDESKPGIEKVAIVAKYLDVSTDYLIGLTNVPQWVTPQDVLDIGRALQLNSTIVAYDGIELTDEEKEQVDSFIRGVLWKRLKNKK